ncbi:MAG TPA: TerB family tellurite resistance protein [Polyangiaceae bacterium]|nr:TerB family tellurite resistance protein [Polyangiaceae bacterium]
MVTAFVFITVVPERQSELLDEISEQTEVVECHRLVGGELLVRLSCADVATMHRFVADRLRVEGVEIRIERVEETLELKQAAARSGAPSAGPVVAAPPADQREDEDAAEKPADDLTGDEHTPIPPPPASKDPPSQSRPSRPRPLTNRERDVIRALAAVVWVDGHADPSELQIVDQVISGYAVGPEQRKELIAFVRSERSLDSDMALDQLSAEDRELLLTNAAIITQADGVQLPSEKTILARLGKLLGYSEEQATVIVQSAVEEGAISLSSRALEDEAD